MKKTNFSWLNSAFIALLGILIINLLFVFDLDARPGGGSSFSGGGSSSSSSSSSSGGSGGEGSIFLVSIFACFSFAMVIVQNFKTKKAFTAYLMLFLAYPCAVLVLTGLVWLAHDDFFAMMFAVIAGVIGLFAFIRGTWIALMRKYVGSKPTKEIKIAESTATDHALDLLKTRDPNFSKTLFLDFASSVFNQFYHYRGTKDFVKLTPYFSEEVIKNASRGVYVHQQVQEIVIGVIKIKEILDETLEGIVVDITANYTIHYKETGEKTRYINTERWLFSRDKGLMSFEPNKLQVVCCPSCGSPADFTESGECNYCKTVIHAGKKQWFVQKISVLKTESFEVQGLGHSAEEVGTDNATILSANLETDKAQFAANHGLIWENYWKEFESLIVQKYFFAIYEAWTAQKWSKVRHLVSDRLFDSNLFWEENYKKENLINKLENIKINRVDIVKIELDKFYESFTVRVFATCYDYTEDKSGKLIGGEKTERFFSEYWTFVRRTGTEKKLDTYNLNNCPSCGAAADKMGQAAICGYCGSKVSTGDFSWVLAVITQDEMYEG